MRGLWLAAGVLVGLGIPLWAQETPLRSRLDPATYEALRPILEAARRDSIPVRPLETRALYGAARRLPPDQIVAAVQRLAADLKAVRAVLREALPQRPVSDGEVVAAEAAQRQGVAVADLAALWREAPPRVPLEIPFAVLGELVQRGVPADEALRVIEHVVETGVPQDRIVQIPRHVDVALGVGAPPAAALGSALQSLGIPRPPTPRGRPGPPGAGDS